METDLAGGQRRKLGSQVGRRREHHADHIARNQAVTVHHLGHQLGGPIQDVRLLVGVHLHGPPDRPNRHQPRTPLTLGNQHPRLSTPLPRLPPVIPPPHPPRPPPPEVRWHQVTVSAEPPRAPQADAIAATRRGHSPTQAGSRNQRQPQAEASVPAQRDVPPARRWRSVAHAAVRPTRLGPTQRTRHPRTCQPAAHLRGTAPPQPPSPNDLPASGTPAGHGPPQPPSPNDLPASGAPAGHGPPQPPTREDSPASGTPAGHGPHTAVQPHTPTARPPRTTPPPQQ